jgi:drug/metabolite transporter (DMT)-like permease
MLPQSAGRVSSWETSNIVMLFAILLVVDSLHFVFARALLPRLPAEMSSFLVLGFATVEVGIYQMRRGGIRLGVLKSHWRFFAAIGLLVAASTVLNYAAVAVIDPGTASLLSKTGILFSVGLGLLWLNERLHHVEVVGAFLSIVGVVVIGLQPVEFLWLGSVMVLTSTFLYAVHGAIVKKYGEDMEFGDFFFFRIASVAFFLFIYVLGADKLVLPDRAGWLLVIIAGTVDVVISRSLYYLTLRRMPITIHTIILTLSPVITIIWGVILFDTLPSPVSLAGGALVIIGVLIVTLQRRRR